MRVCGWLLFLGDEFNKSPCHMSFLRASGMIILGNVYVLCCYISTQILGRYIDILSLLLWKFPKVGGTVG